MLKKTHNQGATPGVSEQSAREDRGARPEPGRPRRPHPTASRTGDGAAPAPRDAAGAASQHEQHKGAPHLARPRKGIGLSGKLLILTLVAVMAAEVFVFVPSVANYRKNWLMDRLTAAQIASLAAEAAKGGRLPAKLRNELLVTAQVRSVAVKRADRRLLILQEDMPAQVEEHFDLTTSSWTRLIIDALEVFFTTHERAISVRGRPRFANSEFVEIVVSEAPLRAAMIDFGLNILGLSIIISIFTASLVYLALNSLLVRPMTRMMRNMVRFGANPEDPGRIIAPSGRSDEIGTAEVELARMQNQLVQMLKQKAHLAALGLAVSKINHDLRNMLASAQLISDRLSGIDDATVQRLQPKLISSLDRAIRLCTQTLAYGQAKEAPPERSSFGLRALVEEVGESLSLPRPGVIDWRNEVPPALELEADRDQLFRVLSNLARNAAEAIEGARQARQTGQAGPTGPTGRDGRDGPAHIAIVAERRAGAVAIEVRDTGPGIPPQARAHMFEAFQGSGRKGGTGLGLVIAAELVEAHGGRLEYVDSERGATFRITLPDPQ